MSLEQRGLSVGFLAAAADLSAKQFCCVNYDTTAAECKVALQSSAGGRVVGVLQNKPTAGQAADVMISGVTKVGVGTSGCTAGDYLMVEATTGLVTTATSGHAQFAIALQTGVSGDVIFAQLLGCPANA